MKRVDPGRWRAIVGTASTATSAQAQVGACGADIGRETRPKAIVQHRRLLTLALAAASLAGCKKAEPPPPAAAPKRVVVNRLSAPPPARERAEYTDMPV